MLLTLLFAGCAAPIPLAPLPIEGRDLIVLHSNDHHGRFWRNDDGEYGLAAQRTLVERLRAEAGDVPVLLLSAGDVNTGTATSDLLRAEPDFLGMNLVGYQAMAVGNHEFDHPLEVLRTQESWATFPFLSANVYGPDGARLFEPYRVFELDGLKVAVLGLTTDDTPRATDPANVAGLEFRSPVEEARALVPELRAQADVVIALTHMGHYVDGVHGINAPGDVTLAREVPGIDLIVGGHSQEPVCMEGGAYAGFTPGDPCVPDQQGGAWIVQAHEWGKYVGRAALRVDGGQVRLAEYALVPVNLGYRGADKVWHRYQAEIPEDPEALMLLEPFRALGQTKLGVVVGSLDGALDGERKSVRFVPTNLGKLVAHSQRVWAGGDVAVFAGGGIRASLSAPQVTLEHLYTVLPFPNTIVTVEMSGAELRGYLAVAAAMPADTGAFAQFDGAELVIEGGALVSATIGGAPIDDARSYTLVVNSFMAAGGDTYPNLKAHPGFVDTGDPVSSAFIAFFEGHQPVRAADWAPTDVVRR